MDIVSHGLWGGLALGQKNKRVFLLAFLFGIFPDVFAFGYHFTARLLSGQFTRGPLPGIPLSVHGLYNISHSLVVALAVLLIAFIIWKKSALVVAAWPLHILFDMFTHDVLFFPTPFLWPFPTPFIDGISWATPWVFFGNWIILIVLYLVWWISKRSGRQNVIPVKTGIQK